MNKKILLTVAIVFFVFGFLLVLNLRFAESIITLFGSLLHKQLNVEFWKIGLFQTGIELILFSLIAFLFVKFYDRFPKQVFIISFSSIILLFLWSILHYSINIPVDTPGNDDYRVYLDFLNKYSDTGNISGVFLQFEDTREIFRRTMALVLFHLNCFNYKIIILFANACLIGIMLLFYKSISIERKQKDFLFLILVILVFQFQYYDAVLWAAAATAAVCPVFFSFSTFYFLSKPKYFWLGLIATLLYVASNTVGFLALFIGLIMLIQKKNYKGSFIWLAVSFSTFILYFYNFSINREHHFSSLGEGFAFGKILFCLKYSFTFLGGSMQFFNNTAAPATIGILLWIVFFYLTYKKYYLKNPPIYYLLFFLLSISILVPFCRYQSNMQTPLVIRYSFFSIMAISVSIISMAELINKEKLKKLFLPVFFFALVYHFSANIFFLPEAVLRKDKMIAEIEKFKNAKESMHASSDTNNTNVKSMKELNAEILQKSIEKKIYEIPE